MSADHLIDRATKVDIDEIGVHPLDDLLGGFGQSLRIPAEELYSDRSFPLGECDIPPSSGIAMHDAVGRDKFRGQDIGPFFPADPAKNRVGHPGHRSQKEALGHGVHGITVPRRALLKPEQPVSLPVSKGWSVRLAARKPPPARRPNHPTRAVDR